MIQALMVPDVVEEAICPGNQDVTSSEFQPARITCRREVWSFAVMLLLCISFEYATANSSTCKLSLTCNLWPLSTARILSSNVSGA